MSKHRVYTDQPLRAGEEFDLEPGAARHLVQVLRLKTGDVVTLFNGDGYQYLAHLTETTRREARVKIESRSHSPEPEPPLRVHLGIGLSKGERMDFAIQKAVELGVTRITPLFTEHSVVKLSTERQAKRIAHWRQVIISACEQSGRCRVPSCEEIMTLNDWLQNQTFGPGLLLAPGAPKALVDLPPQTGDLRLLIGPEGGLSATEQSDAERQGFIGVRLGPRVLRTETAPLAALAAMQALWGDFR